MYLGSTFILFKIRSDKTVEIKQTVGIIKITGITFSPALAINSIFEVKAAINMDKNMRLIVVNK